jgi:hypothetical protein
MTTRLLATDFDIAQAKIKDAILHTKKYKELEKAFYSNMPIKDRELSLAAGFYTLLGIKILNTDKIYPLRYNDIGLHATYDFTNGSYSANITFNRSF